MSELIGHKEVESSPSGDASYESHAQPLTGQLLRAMEMNVVYRKGEGVWLEALIQGRPQKVLDITGGYGANLFGHKHPRLMQVAEEYLRTGEPPLVQGSTRATSGALAKKISDIMQSETGEGPWITTLSNSGTEAIEAALKHCLLQFGKKQQSRIQELQKSINEIKLHVETLDEEKRNKLTRDWRNRLASMSADIKASSERKDWLLHMTMQIHDIHDLLDIIEKFNLSQISETPILASLERAYHGKSMGSLHLTHNPKYREPFYVDNKKTLFIPVHADDQLLSDLFESEQVEIIEIGIHQIGLYFGKQKMTKIAGMFVEPIQGEAGVYPLSSNFLALLKKHSLLNDFPLVFDEIQAGMFRTGKMASGHHAHVTADIYCFSKALGGGLAKIGATTIHHKHYQDDFGYLHASTFAEDGYSAAIAIEALDIVSNQSLISDAMEKGQYFGNSLMQLMDKYPKSIKDVRGEGLMMAIEFSENLRSLCFEFHVFAESNMLGHVISSALLHRENIRTAPSLSNGWTLRIQPSLYIKKEDINFFLHGLENALKKLESGDVRYFFQHLYPTTPLADIEADKITTNYVPGKRPLSVFLCHLIDGEHVKRVSPTFIPVKNSEIESRMGLMKRAMEFGIYHAQTLKDHSGNEIDVILMGIPMMSNELKKGFMSKQRSEVIAKVQRAVDYAKELGANTVGLGQFTSIVSGNGLYLDPRGMNLTTGNAYTLSLAVQAAFKEANNRKLNLKNSSVALIGAAGNIISTAAMLMADEVSKLVLIHHSPIEKSPKLLSVVRDIITESLRSNQNSTFNAKVKERITNQTLSNDVSLLDWIKAEEQKDLLVVDHRLEAIKECELVLTGASSGTGFLEPQHFANNAIVVDIAVPANIKPEMLTRLNNERPDVGYFLGGVAKLPGSQSIVTPLFPLETNESFACMAETFAFGFTEEKQQMHIGALTKSMVEKSRKIAEEAGFGLGSLKTKNSL